MAKTSIVDEIEHHPQFCLDLSDPLGAIRMGNSIGRLVIAIQPQRWDSTLAIAIFISGGHSTKAFMRSWKMPSRAAFEIDILVIAAPEYLDIVSRGRWPQSSRLLSRAWRDHGT
jgi:hypothetical protein